MWESSGRNPSVLQVRDAYTVLSVLHISIRMPYTRFHVLRGKHMGKRIYGGKPRRLAL